MYLYGQPPTTTPSTSTGVYGFWKLWAGFIIPYNEFGNVWVWTFWINPLTYVVYGCTMWMYGELYEPIYFGGTYVGGDGFGVGLMLTSM